MLKQKFEEFRAIFRTQSLNISLYLNTEYFVALRDLIFALQEISSSLCHNFAKNTIIHHTLTLQMPIVAPFFEVANMIICHASQSHSVIRFYAVQ